MKRFAARKAPPGWLMSGDQHASYWRLLADAAEARGLTTAAEREALRGEIHQAAFGGPKSAKAINRTTDFDAYKAACLAVSQPAGLEPQLRQLAQPRRREEHCLDETFRCLGLYVEDVAGYVAKVVAEKFGVPAAGALTLDDLSDQPTIRTGRHGRPYESPSQLRQLSMTLWDRLQAHRRAAVHTLHQMRTKAGVPCHCAKICRPLARRRAVAGNAAPEPEHDADESGLPETGELVAVGDEPF